MRRRICARLAAAAAAAGVSLFASAAPSVAATAQPLDPAAAAALASSIPAVSSGSTTRAVSSEEALASASAPGASVWAAPGLSLQQAAGVSSAPPNAATVPAAAAAATACWSNAAWHQWGTWPYEQKIIDTTYWCAAYGSHVTYHSSTTTTGTTLCSTSWRASQLVAGGNGYTWFTIRSSAGFSCPTVIPWISLHPSHYQDVARNAWGSTSFVGSG